MKLITLIENTTSCDHLCAEHGLSLYIETERYHILFDMGQSGRFRENAEALGVDLSAVDFAVLSHGHYDHGGGLAAFLACNDHAPIYLSTHAFEPHYNGSGQWIGLDRALIGQERLVPVADTLRIGDDIVLYSCNNRTRPYPTDPYGQQMAREDATAGMIPEDFRHEQYMWMRDAGRTVLVSGCSHKGVRNLLRWFKPDVLIGGFHFMKLDPTGAGRAVLEESARDLAAQKTCYYTGHCTGVEQFDVLKSYLGERLTYLSTGITLEI